MGVYRQGERVYCRDRDGFCQLVWLGSCQEEEDRKALKNERKKKKKRKIVSFTELLQSEINMGEMNASEGNILPDSYISLTWW